MDFSEIVEETIVASTNVALLAARKKSVAKAKRIFSMKDHSIPHIEVDE
jgi:hypothetical protein